MLYQTYERQSRSLEKTVLHHFKLFVCNIVVTLNMAIGGQEHTIVQYFRTGPGIQSISHNALQVKVATRAFF